MRITPDKKTYSLSPETVDIISDDVGSFLKELKTPRKIVIESRLTVEEILLGFMDEFGDEKEVTYVKNNLFGKPSLTLSVNGKQFNPLEKEDDDEFGNWSSALINNADYTPSYSFNKGVNAITMRFSKKEMNPIFKLLIAIAAAFLVSMLALVLPAQAISYIEENVLDLFYNAFLGLMATIEIPLVFLSVACGIIGIGDSTVFGRIGRKLILRFVGIILVLTTVAGMVFSILFTSFSEVSEGKISLKVGLNLLLDLIPKNLIEPITSGNTMQIVVMAIVIGIALVMLGSKSKIISDALNEGNRIIVYIARIISKLLPVFIFIVLLDMIWNDNMRIFIDMWKPVAAFVAVLIVLFGIIALWVSFKEKVNVVLLLRKMLPTFLIGFGTASSIAANGESAECMHKKLGINQRFVEFGQPTGGVVFMPSTAINFMVCAIYMAAYYEVNVSLLWFVFAIIICSFVAIATPPVPGGAIAAYTVIFSQLGIPSEAVAIVVAMDIIFDLVATAFDGAFLQLELVRQADENNMLDFEVLRNK